MSEFSHTKLTRDNFHLLDLTRMFLLFTKVVFVDVAGRLGAFLYLTNARRKRVPLHPKSSKIKVNKENTKMATPTEM